MIHTRGKKTGFKQEGEQRREGMESKKFVSTKANSFHCNCPMIPHVRLLDGRSICLSKFAKRLQSYTSVFLSSSFTLLHPLSFTP